MMMIAPISTNVIFGLLAGTLVALRQILIAVAAKRRNDSVQRKPGRDKSAKRKR
jgi:hypothetical protein